MKKIQLDLFSRSDFSTSSAAFDFSTMTESELIVSIRLFFARF